MSVEPLTGLMSHLEDAGMIEVAETDPEIEYLFRHVLIQEAAYASLLRQERREVHRLVAASLEHRYPDRLDELAPVLATHHERAGEVARAVDYLERAGHYAMARFANHEALEAFARARRLLGDEGLDPELRRRRARLDLLRVEAGTAFVPTDEGLAILASVREEATAIGDDELLAGALRQIAVERVMRGELYGSPELRDALDRGLSLAASLGDRTLRARLLALLATARYQGAEYRAAIAAYEEAVPILEADGQLADASLYGGHLAIAHAQLGQFERALHWSERASSAGAESGNPNAILDADLARAMIEALRGDTEAAIEYATRAAADADRVDNKACAIVARSVIGEQRILLGQHEQAIQVLEEGAGLSVYCNLVPVRTEFTKALLDSARLRVGGGLPTIERIDRVLELARSIGDRASEAEVLRQRARDGLTAGRPMEDVLADYRLAEQLFRDLEARSPLVLTLQEHARVLRESGREEEAAPLVAEERRLRSEMGLPVPMA
jgi:tetratricopeptide (TPR) repeat protein